MPPPSLAVSLSALVREVGKAESCSEGCAVARELLIAVPDHVRALLRAQEREYQRAAFVMDQLVISAARPWEQCRRGVVRVTLLEMEYSMEGLHNKASASCRYMLTQSGECISPSLIAHRP